MICRNTYQQHILMVGLMYSLYLDMLYIIVYQQKHLYNRFLRRICYTPNFLDYQLLCRKLHHPLQAIHRP